MAERTQSIAFHDHFCGLENPRQAGKVLFPLDEIVVSVLCDVLGGTDSFVEIVRWGEINLDFLCGLRTHERDVRSHDALNARSMHSTTRSSATVSWTGQQACGPPIRPWPSPTRWPSTARRRAVPVIAARVGPPCTWSRPEPTGSSWCSAKRQSAPRKTKSLPSPGSSRSWRSKAPSSPSTPWAAPRPSPGPSAELWPKVGDGLLRRHFAFA